LLTMETGWLIFKAHLHLAKFLVFCLRSSNYDKQQKERLLNFRLYADCPNTRVIGLMYGVVLGW
jgi:hypothetical protein